MSLAKQTLYKLAIFTFKLYNSSKMPYNNLSKSLIVHVAILQVLLFASLPLGHALLQPLIQGVVNVTQIQLNGRLFCSPSGNIDLPPGSGTLGAAGTLLSGSCNGGSGDIGTIITNSTGFFLALISLPQSILFNLTQGVPCSIIVRLPATGTSCQLFFPTGILQAGVELLNLVVNAAGETIAVVSALPFKYIPI